MKTFQRFFLTEENFEQFQNYLRNTGMTFEQLLQKLRSGRPDGVGGNAKFYRIPGTEFGVREVSSSWGVRDTSHPKLVAAHDPFDGENFGQPVAHYGNNVQVLRLQHGSPAGKPYGINKKDAQADDRAVQAYRQRIFDAANLSDGAYERLMMQIIKLNEKGYKVDSSKSGNLLIDPRSDRFNIVDLNPLQDEKHNNNGGDIILMLVDNFFFEKHEFYNDPEIAKAGQEIIKKVERACNKTGLSLGDNGSADYSRELTSGNYKPYVAPPDSGIKVNDVW